VAVLRWPARVEEGHDNPLMVNADAPTHGGMKLLSSMRRTVFVVTETPVMCAGVSLAAQACGSMAMNVVSS
jgi:hypothetical protein